MLRKIIFWLILIVIIIFVVSRVIHKSPIDVISHSPLAPQLKNVNGVTNILLLGIGGGTHDGPNLTDTIILVSLNSKKKDVILVSIPRDLWVPDLNEKVNTAYQIGLDKNPSNGLGEAIKIMTKITGQPIQYAFRMDFQGFEKAINLLGGIDINVPDTLDDYYYPIQGESKSTCAHTALEIQQFTATESAEFDNWQFFSCRYMHLHVGKGFQHMSGQLALEYVRSRHASGSEGTDFARSRRQQLIIEAVKNKIFSLGTLLNPIKLTQLFGIFQDSIDTNINQPDIPAFITVFNELKNAKVHSAVIDFGDLATGRSGLLFTGPVSPEFGYAYILLPRIGNGNFSEIQQYIRCEMIIGNCKVSPLTRLSPIPTINK